MCITCDTLARAPRGAVESWRDVPLDERLSDPRLSGRLARVFIKSGGHLMSSIEGEYHGAILTAGGGPVDLMLIPDPESVAEPYRPHMREVYAAQVAHLADPEQHPQRHTWGPMSDVTHLVLVDGTDLPDDPAWESTMRPAPHAHPA